MSKTHTSGLVVEVATKNAPANAQGLRELIDLAASRKGTFGVVERGKIIGEVDADAIVAAIARYQRSDSAGHTGQPAAAHRPR